MEIGLWEVDWVGSCPREGVREAGLGEGSGWAVMRWPPRPWLIPLGARTPEEAFGLVSCTDQSLGVDCSLGV